MQIAKAKVLSALALLLALPLELVGHVLTTNSPTYLARAGNLEVGRVILSRDPETQRVQRSALVSFPSIVSGCTK